MRVKATVTQKFLVRRLAVTIHTIKGLKSSIKITSGDQRYKLLTHFQEMEDDKLFNKQTAVKLLQTKANCKTQGLLRIGAV